ncbi:GNAT family N-acetyltransferase [Paenibacillus sp. YPG26]|uniref:GNAT family N-acetyltransferase n=1 Tax=Paenibacillus sp. YPG26 TaxID=2878915 RepID=UPI002040996B|nr:GNAT family N-acetyltransferase [Paenibacillus sp. YPG26]USB32399.1 GNAT family N-acetyltransferase [Paenibacillus sp. YPG26]
MEITLVVPDQVNSWSRMHSSILGFIRKYGGQRITRDAYRQIQKLTPVTLRQPGCALFIATVHTEDGTRLAGLSLVAGYGDQAGIVVVHPLYRGRHIGTKLLQAQQLQMGRLSCRVALDNPSSLKMCFNAGLSARRMVLGPTGKPTLVLEDDLRYAHGAAPAPTT